MCLFLPLLNFFSLAAKCPGLYPWGTRAPGWESLP